MKNRQPKLEAIFQQVHARGLTQVQRMFDDIEEKWWQILSDCAQALNMDKSVNDLSN